MTDDIVAQLWRVYGRGDKDAIRLASYAAEEIERLRAELAAEREWKRANIEMAEQLITVTAERDALRAALQYARNLIGPDEIIDAALKGDGDE